MRWTSQMPLSACTVVPAKISTMASTSSATVSRSDANAVRMGLRFWFTTATGKFDRSEERLERRLLLFDGRQRSRELEEPPVVAVSDPGDEHSVLRTGQVEVDPIRATDADRLGALLLGLLNRRHSHLPAPAVEVFQHSSGIDRELRGDHLRLL